MRANTFAVCLLALPVIAQCATSAVEQQRTGGRLAPPPSVKCSRNDLTVYSGKAISWLQYEDRAELVVATDWETTEKVTIPGSAGNQLKAYLLEGDEFQPAHREKVFETSGQVQPNMRVSAWVCSDKAVPPVLDWQPPR